MNQDIKEVILKELLIKNYAVLSIKEMKGDKRFKLNSIKFN